MAPENQNNADAGKAVSADAPSESPTMGRISQMVIQRAMSEENKKGSEGDDNKGGDSEEDGEDESGSRGESDNDSDTSGEGDDTIDEEDDGETDSEEVEDEESEEGEEEEDEGEEGEEEEDEEGDPKFKPRKPIQAIVGGKKVEWPADTKVSVPIDGKMVTMDLHKALSEISGRFVVDRELQRAKRISKEAEDSFTGNQKAGEDLKKVEELVAEAFSEAMSEGDDAFTGFHMLAEMVDIDPLEFEKRIMFRMSKFLLDNQEYFGDPKKEQTFLELRKGRYLSHKDKRQKELREKSQKAEPLKQAIKELKTANRLTDADWEEAESVLLQAKKSGKIEKLEPRQTVEMALHIKAVKRAETLISETVPDLRKVEGGAEKFSEIQKLVANAIRNYDPTDEELEEIIRDASSEFVGEGEDQRDRKRLGKKVGPKHRADGSAKPKKVKPVRTFAEMREMASTGYFGRK